MQKRKRLIQALVLILLILLSSGVYQRYKALPEGLNQAFPMRNLSNVQLLVDTTYLDAQGQRQSQQTIFDEVIRLVSQAKKVIVLDMFLFNDYQSENPELTRRISSELVAALLTQKKAHPELKVQVISDPINTFYGGANAPLFDELKAAGIKVTLTDLHQLRASNPSWSGFWALCCAWAGNTSEGGALPNILGPGKATLRSYLDLLNFKANHRKTLVVDEGKNWTGLVTTANPHDGSSAHGNMALRFQGPAVRDLFQSEQAVARFSGEPIDVELPLQETPHTGQVLQILTEGQIPRVLIETIDNTQTGDQIQISVFYFSHRPLIKALLKAQQRGVQLKLILDPNKDAFGREKNGIPNRQVAWELHKAGAEVRFCDTHGEQCHSKTTLITGPQKPAHLFLGSANYTRRNFDNLNLETTAHLVAAGDTEIIKEAQKTFEALWQNGDNKTYTTKYSTYADHSHFKYWQYRLMEASGWSTF